MRSDSPTSRREFLRGRDVGAQSEQLAPAPAAEMSSATDQSTAPSAGDTIRLATRAMACEFSVIMNPGPGAQVMAASGALDAVQTLENQISVYREHSELSQLNARAAWEPVEIEQQLFEFLLETRRLCLETEGGFDPTSGPLISLWRLCRQQGRIPTQQEIASCRERTGMERCLFDEINRTVRYDRDGVELNLGGIGKGYALDRAGEFLVEQGLEAWLFHGGQSSMLARGVHHGTGGWPVGICNPLFPQQRLATVLLQDGALSSSGSGVQHFWHQGKRYGHILDPRTGWPVEHMLSVTVLAPTAAEADALSTAFYVIGVENAQRYCDNHKEVSAMLIPPPRRGRTLEPINCGIPDEVLYCVSKPASE